MANESGRRRSKKQQQIVKAAAGLFKRFGFKRVTVEEICRTAGVSKMTFYKYYPNKTALLKSIWIGWIDEGFERLEDIDAMDIPFQDKLRRIIEYKTALLEKMSPEFIDEVLRGDSGMRAFVTEMQQRTIELFMEYIRRAQDRGDMRRMRPEFFLSIFDWMREIVNNDRLRRLYSSDADFIREIQNFFFFGVLPGEKRRGG